MQSSISQFTKHADSEISKISSLDLVKHCMNTIINSLTHEDYLGITSFTTTAKEEFKIVKMDDYGKEFALEAVKNMNAQSSTNLWDGIKVSDNLILQKDFSKFSIKNNPLNITIRR